MNAEVKRYIDQQIFKLRKELLNTAAKSKQSNTSKTGQNSSQDSEQQAQ